MPIFAQVEVSRPYLFSQGHARDISVGGIRIETSDILPSESEVLVRFLLPSNTRPMELPGKVMSSEPGIWIGIAFYPLAEDSKQRILDYLQSAVEEHASAGKWEPPQIPPVRRSGRIYRRVPILLRWRDPVGKSCQEAAETKILSRHGALVELYFPLAIGAIPVLRAPDRGEALCHVVYSAPDKLQGRTHIAVEFLGADDFWGLVFPPEHVTLLPTRRRSARRVQAVPLELKWDRPDGSPHTEALEPCDLSQHGLGIVASGDRWPGPDRVIHVLDSNSGRRTAAYIIWRGEKDSEGKTRMGLEFVSVDDFWGVAFEPDTDYPEPPAPRREDLPPAV